MQQILRKAIEDIINNRMNNTCEGALWIEQNYNGTHIGHH